MIKAAREAKLRTSWTVPDEAYETALKSFVAGVLADRRFTSNFLFESEPLFAAGRVNSFAQTAIKLTAPGVPDVYQGTEGWDLSLVDPDNRRPVDFRRLEAWLGAESPATFADEAAWIDGRAKQHLIASGLRLRGERPRLFAEGAYLPVEAQGAGAGHVVAFGRVCDGQACLTVAPRLPLTLFGEAGVARADPACWGDTALALPPELANFAFLDRVSGKERTGGFLLRDLLGEAPVAILASRD